MKIRARFVVVPICKHYLNAFFKHAVFHSFILSSILIKVNLNNFKKTIDCCGFFGTIISLIVFN